MTLITKAPAFLSWSDKYRVAVKDLPETTQVALMQRGFTHVLGNEVAAYETGLEKKMIASESLGKDDKPIMVREFSPEEVAVMAHDRRMEKLDEMLSGELGTRTVGPRLPKDVQIMRQFARNAIIEAFAKHPNAKAPKASDTKAWSDYIDQYLAVPANADKAKAEAERQLKVAAKSADDGLAFLNSVLT